MVTHSRERALNPRQFELLLEGASRIDCELQRDEARFAVLVLGRLGLRAGELIHMTQDWVNWRSRRIEIPRQQDCHLGKDDAVCGYCKQLAQQMVNVYDGESLPRTRERFINRQLDRPWQAGDELTFDDALEMRWFAKTDSAEREIPFRHDPRVELVIERFFEDHRREGWDRSKSALNRRLNKSLRRASELEEDTTMPHGLRSTAASWHAGRGVNALTLQSLFGWADFQTAERYIADSADQTERALQFAHSI